MHLYVSEGMPEGFFSEARQNTAEHEIDCRISGYGYFPEEAYRGEGEEREHEELE